MPPSAAPEWLRTGWILESSATSAPASNASIAARMPAQPAPTMRTSCLASTTEEATQCVAARAAPLRAVSLGTPDAQRETGGGPARDAEGNRADPADAPEALAALREDVVR